MSMKVRLDASAFAMIVVSLVALASLAPAMRSAPGADRPKSWMYSGRRFSLPSLERARAQPLGGTFSSLCSSREVRTLAARSDTLWIGTEGGLFAYSIGDDTISAVAGPATPSVRSIAFDDGGALWVGSDYGISVRSRGRWRSYTEASLPFFRRIRCMVQGESRFWIGTYGNGCGYLANDVLTVLGEQDSLLDERVLSILEESASSVYFGTASGLIDADTLGWKSLRYGSRLPIGSVNALAFDEDENLFIAIDAQGVAVSSFGRVRTFGTAHDLPGANVHAFSLDLTGHVWAAGGSGVSIFDGSGWTPCPAPGVASMQQRYLSIHHDENGNCYLGTDDGTVLIVSRDAVKEIAVPQAFAESRVSRIRSGNGAIWFIAGRRIYRWKDSFAQVLTVPELYADEMTDLVPTETGELWVTTRFGILHFTGGMWEVFDRASGLSAEYFTRVAIDPSGALWFATFDGRVVTLSAGKWSSYGRENGLSADPIEDLALDGSGAPWIVTRRGVVAHLVQGAWMRMGISPRELMASEAARAADSLSQFDPAIHFLSDEAGGSPALSEAKRYCLAFGKRGACLIGTNAAVYRLAATGWQVIDLPESMRGVRPTAVLGTAKGEIWLGTAGSGVLVYRNGEWLRIGASNGLSDDYIRALFEDQAGTIWIGTQFGGITRFSPSN
jgi:ligand-binding sensor domain-containing protein